MANDKIDQPKDQATESPFENMSNADLQAELTNLGMPADDAKKIGTKSVLISMITTLKANKLTQDTASNENKDEKIDISSVPIDPTEEKKTDNNWRIKTKKQWAFWNSQPTVRIMVPPSGKEQMGVIRWEHDKGLGVDVPVAVSGAIQSVIENGARYLIPKGVYVDVPASVARLIQDKFQQTSEAGKDIKADRIDPETGRPVLDQL